MPANDPATDRRISRLSLLSSAADLYAQKIADPQLVLAAAQMWEAWVYAEPAVVVTNGVAMQSLPLPPSTLPTVGAPAGVCAVCTTPLSEVKFKSGPSWQAWQLAEKSQAKYGKLYCKTHYFGSKANT